MITIENPLFFAGDEVGTLTGFKTPARQVQWLSTKGWRFEVNGSGRPIVARKYAEKILERGVPEEASYRPNFAALQSRQWEENALQILLPHHAFTKK